MLGHSIQSTDRAEKRRKRKEKTFRKDKVVDLNEGMLKYRFIDDPKKDGK
jgi:hypothetical protein